MLTNVKGFCTLIAPRSSIEHQRSVTYLRPVCLQPDPTDGSFDYFACGGSDHWAEHNSESSSDGIEVRRTSRKFLHAHGESPSATGAATGAANQPATQPDHGPASTDTDCHPAAFPDANHAIGISHGRPSSHRTSYSDAAGHPQDAAAEQPSTRHDANVAADLGCATAGTFAKGPSGVHPSQLPDTHLEAAGRLSTTGDAGSASTAQQRTQHPAAKHSHSGEWSSSEHRTGPHTAHQHRLTASGGSTAVTAPTSIRATRSTTRDAPSVPQGTQQKPYTATASTPLPIQKPPPRSTIPQPQTAQNAQASTQDSASPRSLRWRHACLRSSTWT